MVKSFKKAIAVLIAVLMIVCTLPFSAITASAAVGDYYPDVEFQFGCFVDANASEPDDGNIWFQGNYATSGYDFASASSIYNAPVTYDEDAGTLTLEAAKTKGWTEMMETGNLDEDYQLQVGDVFTLTARCDNVLKSSQLILSVIYSDNIEPYGLFQFKGGNKAASKNVLAWGGVSEVEEIIQADRDKYGSTQGLKLDQVVWKIGGLDELKDTDTPFSACDLYGETQNNSEGLLCDDSEIITDDGNGIPYIYINTGFCDGIGDVSTMSQYGTDTSLIVNPETGEYEDDGYEYTNQFVCETFLFRVKDTGKIQFTPYDLDNTKDTTNPGFVHGYFMYDSINDGAKWAQYTTFAPNYYGGSNGLTIVDTPAAGSEKLTFMGRTATQWTQIIADRESGSSTECTHEGYDLTSEETITKEATCTETGLKDVTYTCTNCGNVVKTENDVVIDKIPHTYPEANIVVTPATCTKGSFTTKTCSVCGDVYVSEEADDKIDHEAAEAVNENIVVATLTTKGSHDEVVYCKNCGEELSRETVDDGYATCDHEGYDTTTTETITKEATCSETGLKDVTYYCTNCNEVVKVEKDVVIEKIAHTEGAAVKENAVASTCKDLGTYDEVVYCSVCNEELSREQKTETAYADHQASEAVVENKVASTCKDLGTYDEVVYCSVCGEELSRTQKTETEYAAHQAGDAVKENEVAATKSKDGSYDTVVYCSVCNEELSRETTVVPALGYTVTVESSDLGTVSGLAYGANTVKPNAAYTVTASAIEGATFEGWAINGKLVSTNATYSSVATNDVTITPVFTEADEDNISVTFFDPYGNIIDQYSGPAADVAYPETPTIAGYTFSEWSLTLDEIKAATDSVAVWAKYEQNTTVGYTVTTDATVVLPDGIENGSIPYDTKVTVTAEGAVAWKLGDTTVGYGDSYTFFLGADIEVQPVFDDDSEAVATVTAFKATLFDDYRVQFLATRNIPDGYSLVNAGFVYGKNLTADELNLDNVGNTGASAGAGQVKVAYASQNGSDQFALNYGIKAKAGTASVKAFVVVKKGSTTTVIYSDVLSYQY
jgi:hypothetical protein